MKNEFSKKQIEDMIKDRFSKNYLSPEDIKKIKKLAMSKNIKLKEYKKRFCKKCYSMFNSENYEIRIKKPYKIIRCKTCGNISRYKLV
jgi:RNase P subunit RPR2